MTRIVLYLLAIASPLPAQEGLEDHFEDFDGTIVIYDEEAKRYTVHNEERARTRYSPFSTFKIPSSLIALETGVVSDTAQVLLWDKQKYPAEAWWPEPWREEQNLRGAFRYSVVPLYRRIASQVGAARMQDYLDRFDYGNRDISSGIDSFWLNGSLKISAFEQITFLAKLYHRQLPVAPATMNAVADIMVDDVSDGVVLRSKTGGGTLDGGTALGWYVGYVERGGTVYFFALNIAGDSFDAILEPRIEIAKRILRELGIL